MLVLPNRKEIREQFRKRAETLKTAAKDAAAVDVGKSVLNLYRMQTLANGRPLVFTTENLPDDFENFFDRAETAGFHAVSREEGETRVRGGFRSMFSGKEVVL